MNGRMLLSAPLVYLGRYVASVPLCLLPVCLCVCVQCEQGCACLCVGVFVIVYLHVYIC